MSRQLPDRPNLDHLRKQAKDLLGDLKRRNPDAKLADALHAIAREYGFATWPLLKAHLASLPPVNAHAAFAGSWIVDLARSAPHPALELQHATLDLSVDGDALTISDVVVNRSGQVEWSNQTIHVDGQPHPAGNERHALVARWLGDHLLEALHLENGEVVGRGTYEVSADGATLTVTSPAQVLVLARTRSA